MASCLAKITAIAQIAAGAICILPLLFLLIYGIYPQEQTVLFYQMACCALGSLGVLLGLETLMFKPKEERGRRNALIFHIASSVVVSIILLIVALKFSSVYLGETILDSETEIFGDVALFFHNLAFMVGCAAAVIILISTLSSCYMLYKKTDDDDED